MSYVRTYDPLKVTLALFGFDVIGAADGTKYKITRETDDQMDEAGTDGDVVVVKSADRRATLEITLQSASPTNDLLSAQLAAQLARQSGLNRSMQLKDVNGTSVAAAETAWIARGPDLEFGKEAGNRVWKVRIAALTSFVGGTEII